MDYGNAIENAYRRMINITLTSLPPPPKKKQQIIITELK